MLQDRILSLKVCLEQVPSGSGTLTVNVKAIPCSSFCPPQPTRPHFTPNGLKCYNSTALVPPLEIFFQAVHPSDTQLHFSWKLSSDSRFSVQT